MRPLPDAVEADAEDFGDDLLLSTEFTAIHTSMLPSASRLKIDSVLYGFNPHISL